MTEQEQKVAEVKKSGGSIGFLNASEKMQISTFEIPLTFLEDLGFSKEKIGAAKNFNRRFVSGFYTKVRGLGAKLSFRGGAKAKPATVAKVEKPQRPKKATRPTETPG